MLTCSTRIRYATRSLMDIALQSPDCPVPVNDISARQKISVKYLESIMPPLKSAGLVVSSKGAHGGYLLAKPPSRITLFDVVCAFGGPVDLVSCVNGGSACDRVARCSAYDAWKELSDMINARLKSITIAGLAARQRQKEQQCRELVYHI